MLEKISPLHSVCKPLTFQFLRFSTRAGGFRKSRPEFQPRVRWTLRMSGLAMLCLGVMANPAWGADKKAKPAAPANAPVVSAWHPQLAPRHPVLPPIMRATLNRWRRICVRLGTLSLGAAFNAEGWLITVGRGPRLVRPSTRWSPVRPLSWCGGSWPRDRPGPRGRRRVVGRR